MGSREISDKYIKLTIENPDPKTRERGIELRYDHASHEGACLLTMLN
jgi:hypothetical protein